jgi:hypothetical protein
VLKSLLSWWSIRWSLNPLSTRGLVAIGVIATALLFSALGVYPGAMILVARISGIVLLVEILRFIRRPRNPLPSGTAPLIRWTPRLVIASLMVGVIGVIILLGIVGALT